MCVEPYKKLFVTLVNIFKRINNGGGGFGGSLNPRIQTTFEQNPGFNNNFLKNPNPMQIPQILQNPKSNEFSFKNPRSNDIFFNIQNPR